MANVVLDFSFSLRTHDADRRRRFYRWKTSMFDTQSLDFILSFLIPVRDFSSIQTIVSPMG